MTDAPAVITFTPHATDYIATRAPWYIEEKLSEGTQIKTGDHSTHIYVPGGSVERVIGSVIMGRTDSDLLAMVAACDSTIADPGPAHQQTWTTTQTDWEVHAGDGFWPSGLPATANLYLAWQRSGADVTIGADAGIWWGNLVVLHTRYTYAGSRVNVVTSPSLDPRQIVHDLMGRGVNALVEFDVNRVEPGTSWATPVAHAAWPSGVSAREVLSYAGTYAPGMWWAVLEPGPSGLPKFEVGRWDSPPRYVLAPGMPGVELSGGADQLANRCLVRYVGAAVGNAKSTWVAAVRANLRSLSASGQTRTMVLDVTGEGLMDGAEARKRGLSALRQAALAKTAGKVVVNRPIFDYVEGRMVEPWEIRDGCTVVACDAPLSYGRSTSMTESVGADGVAVFRCRGVSYEAAGDSATLDLDGGSRSLIGRLKIDAMPRRYDVGDART